MDDKKAPQLVAHLAEEIEMLSVLDKHDNAAVKVHANEDFVTCVILGVRAGTGREKQFG